MTETYRSPTDIDEAELEAIGLDRQPGSIRDIQYLYGQLYSLGQQPDNSTADADIPRETKAVLTPDYEKLAEIHNEPDSAVIVELRMDRDAQQLSYSQTIIRAYDTDLQGKLAYARYPAGRGHDHSITHLCGESASISTVISAAKAMFGTWPTEGGVQQLHDTHPDGWILTELARIGSDETTLSQMADDIESQLSGNQRRIVSIRVFDEDDPATRKFPVDIDVLLNAIPARAEDKLATKNDVDAEGTGAGYIRGDDTATVFGATTDPLNLYTSKKRAWIDRFDGDQGMYTHPITLESAMAIKNSDPLVTSCRQTDAGGGLYYLPYFAGEQTTDKLRALYEILWSLFNQESDIAEAESVLRRVYDSLTETDTSPLSDLQFWMLHIVSGGGASRKRAFANNPSTTVIDLYELATESAAASQAVHDSDFFTLPDGAREDGEYDSELQLDPTADHLTAVGSITYFLDTCYNPSLEDDGIIDTAALQLYRTVTSGEQIDASELFHQYALRLNDEFQAMRENGDETTLRLETTVIRQYIQLQALTRSGYLNYNVPVQSHSYKTSKKQGSDKLSRLIDREQSGRPFEEEADKRMRTDSNNGTPTAQSMSDTIDPATRAKKEAESYQAYIESHSLLSDHPQRRAAFTLGALITTVARVQKEDNKTPITERVGPTTVTKRNISDRVTQIIDLVTTYAAMEGKIIQYDTMLSQLADDMQHTDPANWDISTDDIQLHVGLGMAYGASYRDYSTDE